MSSEPENDETAWSRLAKIATVLVGHRRTLSRAGLMVLAAGLAVLAAPFWESIAAAIAEEQLNLKVPSSSALGWWLVGLSALPFASDVWLVRSTARMESARRSLDQLYVYLESLLSRCHVTRCRVVLAPSITMRIGNALPLLRRGRLLPGVRAMFDKRASDWSAEVEHGRPFPLAAIAHVVDQRRRFADNDLVDLVASAERARFEKAEFEREHRDVWSLSAQELALFDHIVKRTAELRRQAAFS